MSSKKSTSSPKSQPAKRPTPAKAQATPKKSDVAIAATEKSRKAVIDSIQTRLDGNPPPSKTTTKAKAAAEPNGGTKLPKRKGVPKDGAHAMRSRLSAIDAAAQVLSKAGKPMRAQDLVDAMATSGLWKSPGGKTPSATLSAAIGREIKVLGPKARFKKADRGFFAATSAASSGKGS